MLSKLTNRNPQQLLEKLPRILLKEEHVEILETPSVYKETLLRRINHAKQRIYLVALYLEQDEAGQEILEAIYKRKEKKEDLDIAIFVDWHRAQRSRIGENATNTNAHWYYAVAKKYPTISIPILGVPVSTKEAFGVLHLKGSVIDDTTLYTGASINNVYLHQLNKYRYDRYFLIKNSTLADSFIEYLQSNLVDSTRAVTLLNKNNRAPLNEIKKDIKKLRLALRKKNYAFPSGGSFEEMSITPVAGIGKQSPINQVLTMLMRSVEKKVIICTPYFNLPTIFKRNISSMLRQGKKVEIIVGDKTANDFYIPEEETFKIIGTIPYLYEKNLRRFMYQHKKDIENDNLIIRLWKDGSNSYHAKGIWVDSKWIFITGHNLNPRALNLDLENGLLIHDPKKELLESSKKELKAIRYHTTVVKNYQHLESEKSYPPHIHRILRRLKHSGLDKLLSKLL